MQFRNRSYRRQVYKTGSVFSVGPTTARYAILLFLAVFSLLFLIEAAQGSDSLIELRALEQKKTELNKELTTLQVNASRLQSLQKLSQSASEQGLVATDSNLETISINTTPAL